MTQNHPGPTPGEMPLRSRQATAGGLRPVGEPIRVPEGFVSRQWAQEEARGALGLGIIIGIAVAAAAGIIAGFAGWITIGLGLTP